MTKRDREVIQGIFKTNLGVKKRERILVFTDSKRGRLNAIARLFAETGKGFTPHISLCSFAKTDSHGSEPPEELWRAAFGEALLQRLKEERLMQGLINKRLKTEQLSEVERAVKKYKADAVDAVIALSYHSTSHTKFRDLLTRICGARYASMPLFDASMLRTAMRVNWQVMSRRTKTIARRVERCDSIEITTPRGTELRLRKGGREVRTDTGIIRKPGGFSNLPAGEVYLAPLEGTAEGRLVLAWAPTRRLRSEVTVTIKDGKASSVSGSERYAGHLREMLAQRPENANVAELGIGTNDRASRPDNILESEKIFGTIHIALGDNSSFGGRIRTPFHQDFIFFRPTVTLIYRDKSRKNLLKDGKLSK